MAILPGTNCAEALVAANLPFNAIVEALITEVGLTRAEASMAALVARLGSRGASHGHHAHA